MVFGTGMWRLRCRKCSNVFDINVACDDELRRLVKQYLCPHCLTAPYDRGGGFELQWHEIVGFHLSGACGCRADSYTAAEECSAAVVRRTHLHGH